MIQTVSHPVFPLIYLMLLITGMDLCETEVNLIISIFGWRNDLVSSVFTHNIPKLVFAKAPNIFDEPSIRLV